MHRSFCEPERLLAAMRLSLLHGGAFLESRLAPRGPIMRERNLSYIHKACWGLHAAGWDSAVIARLLDWARKEALQPNGDFYFPDEPPEYKDMQRVYRPLTFLRVAAWMGHPLVSEPVVIDRIMQYQHPVSGGVFHWIGEDPDRPAYPPTIGVLNTTFFGQLMIALGRWEPAIAAGNWVVRWIQANAEHMPRGLIYTQMTPEGQLVTEVSRSDRIGKLVDTHNYKQEFWQVGTAIAFLAALYHALRSRCGQSHTQAQIFLDSALKLLEFESTMPLETYLWPSKCKVGWGAGELLRVLVRYQLADEPTVILTYRIAERVAIFTFMDAQLADGGWPCMHYPLAADIPEIAFNYRPVKGLLYVPDRRIAESKTIFLPREEITGEFLGEMRAIELGVAEWLAAGRKPESVAR